MSARVLWPAAILFDLDGTLADSFVAIHESLARALAEHGLEPRSLDWVRAHVGRGSRALVEDAVGGGEVVVRALLETYLSRYRELYLERTPPLPGALEVVAHVAGGGAGIGVVSNKNEAFTRAWLEHVGLAELVGAVTGPDVSGFAKPDPRAVAPVLRDLHLGPESAVLVGDMTVDVETGRNAGMPVVAVASGAQDREALARAGAVEVLGAVSELPGWLRREGRGWE